MTASGRSGDPLDTSVLVGQLEIIIVEIPAERPVARERELPCRNLGLIGPVTRDVIYADIG